MLSTWEEKFQKIVQQVRDLQLDGVRDRGCCTTGERLQDNMNARFAARLKALEERLTALGG